MGWIGTLNQNRWNYWFNVVVHQETLRRRNCRQQPVGNLGLTDTAIQRLMHVRETWSTYSFWISPVLASSMHRSTLCDVIYAGAREHPLSELTALKNDSRRQTPSLLLRCSSTTTSLQYGRGDARYDSAFQTCCALSLRSENIVAGTEKMLRGNLPFSSASRGWNSLVEHYLIEDVDCSRLQRAKRGSVSPMPSWRLRSYLKMVQGSPPSIL